MRALRGLSIKVFLAILLILALTSCSDQQEGQDSVKDKDINEMSNNDEGKNEEEPEKDYSEMSESELAEHFPPSEVYLTNIPNGSLIVNDIEISEVELEILDTMSEYDAVQDESGTTLTLPDNILFDFDSDQLRSEADDAIQKLTQVIESTDGDVLIVGHTDNKGETDYNQTLSEARAEAVLNALVDEGIDSSRLESEGRGETEPVARNAYSNGDDDPDGRQKNRRVEVTVDGL